MLTAARSRPVLLLGGYGAVGAHLARQLCSAGTPVIVAGRDAGRGRALASRLSGAEGKQLDIGDSGRLGEASQQAAAVVNCTGVEDLAVATAVLNGGTDFVDISATRAYLDSLSSLGHEARASGARLLINVGLAPGLSTLLAIELHETAAAAGPIELVGLLGSGEEAGLASRVWTFHQLGRRFPDTTDPQGSRTVRNFSKPRTVSLPAGFGRRRAYRFDFPDQHLLSRQLGVPVTARYCFDSRLATVGLALIARVPSMAPSFERATRRPLAGRLGGEWWVMSAQHVDGRSHWAIGENQARGTASVTALALEHLSRHANEPGVHHLHELTTARELAPALQRRQVLISW